ncbi:unnamed protein product [Rhodiola kirilowii]
MVTIPRSFHQAQSQHFILTKARDRADDNIITVEKDGYLWEHGPNSFQPNEPLLTLAVDSGLKDDLVFGDPDAPTLCLMDGKLRPVSSKPADFPFFDLIRLSGKLRAVFGALGIRPPPPVLLKTKHTIFESANSH